MSEEKPTRDKYTRKWRIEILFKNGEKAAVEKTTTGYYKHSLGIEELDDRKTTYEICDSDSNTIFCAHTSEIAGVIATIIEDSVQEVANPYYKEGSE